MTLSEDQLIRMCRELDRVEADLRGRERALYHLRMQLREGVSVKRRNECGFVEGDEGLRPNPKFAAGVSPAPGGEQP